MIFLKLIILFYLICVRPTEFGAIGLVQLKKLKKSLNIRFKKCKVFQ